MRLKVLVVDDQEVMRNGIAALLRRYSDCEVVGQAADGEEAVAFVAEHQPDIVVLDVSLPTMSGTEAAKAMIALDPDIKILAVSAYTDADVIAGIMQAGAYGYILKDFLFDELAEGIRAVGEGKRYYSPHIADKVPAEFS